MDENGNMNVDNQTVDNGGQDEQKLSFTQEELDALIQSKADQRVQQALKTVERKNAEKIKQAEKLAKMNESEKFQFELEQREKAIAEKEHALAIAENKNEASKILADKGLSVALVDFVVAEDAETMNANIKLLEDEFKKSVKLEVERRLATNTPKKNLPLNQELTAETFKQMTLTQQMEVYKNNPELYKQFSGR